VSESVKRIITRQDLDEFLSLVAEESVVKARDDLRDGTYASEEEILQRAADGEKKSQSSMSKDLDRLANTWGTEYRPQQAADEADEDIFKAIAKGANSDPDASDSPPDIPKKPEKKDADEEEKPEFGAKADDPDVAEGRISFTMIRDKLNTIRSGRSLRDKDIKAELKDYITNLDAEEKLALHTFLDGIGQILTAGIEGEEAAEPSEDPPGIEMKKMDEPETGEKERPAGRARKPVSRSRQRRGVEDTSAPIQVGRRQRTEALRRKVRELLG